VLLFLAHSCSVHVSGVVDLAEKTKFFKRKSGAERTKVGQGRRKFPEKKRFDFFSIIL